MTQNTTRLILLLMLLVGCNNDPAPSISTPTAVALTNTPDTTAVETAEFAPAAQAAPQILISELLLGLPGSNSTEFIELTNTGPEPVDLTGWQLIYVVSDNSEEIVYAWDAATAGNQIPPFGHFLLVHEGRDVGVIADGVFANNLFDRRGGLILSTADGAVADQVGWGDAPAGVSAGLPAPAPASGASLERLPGGTAGNMGNEANNQADFVLNTTPNPQNTGSLPTPLPEAYLRLVLEAPAQVEPGMPLDMVVTVHNESDTAVSPIEIALPQLPQFTPVTVPDGAVVTDDVITWTIEAIPAGETAVANLTWQTPYTYLDAHLTNATAATANRPTAFGNPLIISVSGGAIPVATARTLTGSTVSVEGVVTMYTGGFFAGTTGTKFYLEDESGGVQVYVPGGQGIVDVAIGDRVRATGEIEVYRNSVELVPGDPAADVTIVGTADALPPLPITIAQHEQDDAILGRLTQIEGIASRIAEFNFSYEIDLVDDEGNTTLVLIEKDTGVMTDEMEVGQSYRVTGISEFYSGQRQIKPRLPTDIVPVFPPVLLLTQTAVDNAQPGETITITLTAVNHTPDPLTNVRITAVLPTQATVGQIFGAGQLADDGLTWEIASLDGLGASAVVSYTAQLSPAAAGVVSLDSASVVADQWSETAVAPAHQTFIGLGIPIWAIQGDGDRSPYVNSTVTTSGVVTGIFPELDGFWLQTTQPDDNPVTSDGLFVLADGLNVALAPGDAVQINGRVREIAGQTTLDLATAADLQSTGAGELAPAIPYNPPADPAEALLYNEAREGMLVAIIDPALAVAPSNRFGEYGLVLPEWGVDQVSRDDPAGYLILVDDGSDAAYETQAEMPYAVSKGDLVANVVGPLAYTFDNFKIEPIAAPLVQAANSPLPTLPMAAANQFSIATFNVENLFDPFDPHPSSPQRPSLDEYNLRLTKLADTIVRMGVPTVVALQEVENIGVLEDVAAHELLAAYGYAPLLLEGNDSRGIDVGYLVRRDQATIEGAAIYDAPGELFSRPPLVLTVTVPLESGSQQIVLLNNHFLALSGGEAQTEPVRTAQAAWNAAVMAELQAQNPTAEFVVLGDLNSFYQTPPLDTLQAAGLRHVNEWFADASDWPYTYIFNGMTQALDHLLMTPGLFDQVTAVNTLQTNSSYPLPLPDDATARHLSDHDPLVVLFTITP